MIPEAQTLQIVKEHFPEIPFEQSKNSTGSIRHIADHLMTLLGNQDYTSVQKLLHLVNDLHGHACAVIRNGFENILYYQLGTWMASRRERKELQRLLPAGVEQIIARQFISSSI
jgi:uncharacterized protein YjiS (DUF1127 family)